MRLSPQRSHVLNEVVALTNYEHEFPLIIVSSAYLAAQRRVGSQQHQCVTKSGLTTRSQFQLANAPTESTISPETLPTAETN